jgi:hypothetical protein
MQCRVTLTSLLAAVMFSIACVASACEIRCDLMSLSQPCHGGATAGAAVQHPSTHEMAVMSHCLPSKPASSDAAVFLFASDCQVHYCAQQATLSAAKGTAGVDISTALLPAIETISSLVPDLSARTFVLSSSPPGTTPSPISLHTTLRV